jgi:FAD-dependent monooxygenase
MGAIIGQDEKDTWTTHLQLPLDTDPDTIDSYDAVYTVLGGGGPKYEIKIDEILVRSTYRPSIAVARSYISPRSTIFLAGDSAHQNIPTGGYGMNMGLGDSFDLGWKLATVINGHGGDFLLQSYEEDRRHIALNTIERSGVHIAVHINGAALLTLPYAELSSDAGIAAKKKVHQHYQENDGENKDLGIEMGFRYASSICIPDYSEEPEWKPAAYIPSTFPGSRAPHVFLSDGTPIFDHLGQYYTLVDFSEGSEIKNTALLLLNSAKEQNVPLKHLQLPDEHHARTIWEAVPFLVIRPDAHVAWRGSEVKDVAAAKQIIELISGFAGRSNNKLRNHGEDVPLKFSSVKDVTVQETTYVLDKMGLFQA